MLQRSSLFNMQEQTIRTTDTQRGRLAFENIQSYQKPEANTKRVVHGCISIHFIRSHECVKRGTVDSWKQEAILTLPHSFSEGGNVLDVAEPHIVRMKAFKSGY